MLFDERAVVKILNPKIPVRQSYLEAFETTQLQMQRELKGLRKRNGSATHTRTDIRGILFSEKSGPVQLGCFLSMLSAFILRPPVFLCFFTLWLCLTTNHTPIVQYVPVIVYSGCLDTISHRGTMLMNTWQQMTDLFILTKVGKGRLPNCLCWWFCWHDIIPGEVPILGKPLCGQKERRAKDYAVS